MRDANPSPPVFSRLPRLGPADRVGSRVAMYSPSGAQRHGTVEAVSRCNAATFLGIRWDDGATSVEVSWAVDRLPSSS